MKRLLLLASMTAGALTAQFGGASGRDARWQTRGSGPVTDRPATCMAARDVWICLGAGCTDGKNIHYCTGPNTWTEQGVDGVGGGAPTDGSYLTRTVDGNLPEATAISGLPTGFVHGTTSTGAVGSRVNLAGTGVSIANGDGASGNPTFNNLAPAFLIVDDGAGSGDPYTACPAGFPVAYAPMVIDFVPLTANSGPAALNVCGLGALAIKKDDGTSDPSDADLISGRHYSFRWVAGTPAYWRMAPQASADPNTITAAAILASDAPMIGAGSKAAAVGARSGNTTEFVTVTGTKAAGAPMVWDSNGNAISKAAVEFPVIPLPALSSLGANTLTAPDTLYVFPFVLSLPTTVSNVSWRLDNVNDAAGTVDFCIYDASKTRVAAVGGAPTSVPASSYYVTALSVAPVALQPGFYWYGVTSNSSTVNFRGVSSSAINNIQANIIGMNGDANALGSAGNTTGGVCPSSFTTVTNASFNMPFVAFN